MEAFVRALARFIARDIPYIVGGISVIVAGAALLGVTIPTNMSTTLALFIAGVGYAIGFAIQEGLSLTPLLNTSVKVKPSKLIIYLYERSTRFNWKEPAEFDPFDTYLRMYAELPQERIAAIERMNSLKHVGATMGANWLVCSVLLLLGGIVHESINQVVLGGSCLVISGILLLIAGIQGMQAYKALGWLSTSFPVRDTD